MRAVCTYLRRFHCVAVLTDMLLLQATDVHNGQATNTKKEDKKGRQAQENSKIQHQLDKKTVLQATNA